MSLQPRTNSARGSVHAPMDEAGVTWRERAKSQRSTVSGERGRVIGFIALSILIGTTWTGAAAADCAGQPNLREADGHWHYRIDRLNHHKCWYLQSQAPSAASSSAESKGVTADAKSATSSLASFFAAWKSSISPPQPDAAVVAKAPEASSDSGAQKNIAPIHRRRWALNEKRTSKSELRPVESEHAEPQHQQSSAERDELFNEFLRWSMRPQ